MKTIWKYELTHEITNLAMPKGAEVISVQYQGMALCLWAIVDPDAEPARRSFQVVGTGWVRPGFGKHIDTVQQGPFVWHVFEVDQ